MDGLSQLNPPVDELVKHDLHPIPPLYPCPYSGHTYHSTVSYNVPPRYAQNENDSGATTEAYLWTYRASEWFDRERRRIGTLPYGRWLWRCIPPDPLFADFLPLLRRPGVCIQCRFRPGGDRCPEIFDIRRVPEYDAAVQPIVKINTKPGGNGKGDELTTTAPPPAPQDVGLIMYIRSAQRTYEEKSSNSS